jgi:hypothetical protein
VEAHLGQRPDDGPARGQLDHPVLARVEEQRRLVSGVDVDEVPVALELGIEDGDEAAGERAAVDDAVELGEDVRDLQLALEPHAQAGDHVAYQQRRGQAVPAGVADGQPQHVLVEDREIEEVAADLLRRA